VLVGGLLEETSVSLFPSILSLFSLSLGTYRAIVHAQKANQKQEEQRKKKEEQTKESGASFDPNIRLGPKLDPTAPLHTPYRRCSKF
jgi:hypothetical protein